MKNLSLPRTIPEIFPLNNRVNNYNYRNIISNGNFSNGTTGWTSVAATIIAANNALTVTGNGISSSTLLLQNTSVVINLTKKYYVRCKVIPKNNSLSGIVLQIDGSTAGTNINLKTVATPNSGNLYLMDGVSSPSADFTGVLAIKILGNYADASTANGKSFDVKEVTIIDLTALFGPGLEPTASECQLLFPFFVL